ncbi:MAG: hypothetical protein H8E17_08625 [Deltaproteobacteria bacterium]|nr:hypothetical protein [Deltaproteobacteria bacterium]
MAERELVKIVCDNEVGYYTQFKDSMKPGDVEYIKGKVAKMKGEPGPGIQDDAGDPPAEPIRQKRGKKKS